jgi:uroporphyrinogen decarboxylase
MNDRFLRALRREPVDCTPVWFMRQAGRYMAEYRAIRAKYTLLEICKQPEVTAEVTLQPTRLGVDACILFADILLPLDPMGCPFSFEKGEGPVLHKPIRQVSDVDDLRLIDPRESLGYVLEGIRLSKQELAGKLPLIGFAGAPFTLASYLLEGGKSTHFLKTKRFMIEHPEAWGRLMEKLSTVVADLLLAQIDAGADAVQLFDSWVGQLSPYDYTTYVLPHVQGIFAKLKARNVPTIHFGTGTATLLEHMAKAESSALGLDWRMPFAQGWDLIGHDRACQGNLDPCMLFAPQEKLFAAADRILTEAGGRAGHVFNVGHGILPETDPGVVKALVDHVHEASRRS